MRNREGSDDGTDHALNNPLIIKSSMVQITQSKTSQPLPVRYNLSAGNDARRGRVRVALTLLEVLARRAPSLVRSHPRRPLWMSAYMDIG